MLDKNKRFNMREEKITAIYGIKDIKTDDVIYIGLTTKNKGIERWYQHRYSARHLSETDKSS